MSYTFTIDNQTDVALQNISFSDILPPPVIWAAEPYFLDGLSIGTTNITGSQTANFTIAQVEAQTVATFVLDAYLGTWNTSGVLENTATLDNLPDFINGNGNAISATSENVNVYSNPNISTDNFISIYENETATLTANIGEGINPIWTTASDGILTTPNDVTTMYIPSESDIENGFVQFGISTVSPLGCGEANDTVYLEILPLLESVLSLNFIADTLQVCENECIHLTDLSVSGSEITSFEWQLVGSETPFSSEQNPEVCYTAAGTYDITLIASTDFATDTLLLADYITVLDCTVPVDTISIKPATLIPNAFSPNNDGVNDEFGIAFSNENISDFHIVVYNRWGNEVFRSSDINEKWNGTYKNEECEIGLYVYFVSFNIDGIKEQYKGNVTMIR